jgi:hypothetical protein
MIKATWPKCLMILLLIGSNMMQAQNNDQNFKRGYGFGQHMQADMEALSAGASWWYNWWHRPDAGNDIIDVYQDFGMEFVPQAWSKDFNEEALRQYLDGHADVDYIMGFNEPNFVNQANLTPAEVAAQWYKIEAIADDYDLKIVGPALNYSPDAPYNDPFDWMDEWLNECDAIGGCRFDYVNVHSYMNTVSALEWYLNEWKQYGKPIWLTEFCAWDGIETTATPEYQKNFMLEALPMLDNDADVYRYAWFVARSSGIPYNSLLTPYAGELTELGLIYTDQYEPSLDQITLRVIDQTKGEVTNSNAWPNESVYTWLGNTTNWAAVNNMPVGALDGEWVGMYSGLDGGELTKTNDEWIWSFTFAPMKGYTYNWNPGIWNDAERTENNLQDLHVGRNLEFTVDIDGNVSGELTLLIEDALTATPVESNFSMDIPENYQFDDFVSLAPNPTSDMIHIFSPRQLNSVVIYNLNGKVVMSTETKGSVSVNQLSPGQYLMKINASDDYMTVKKFIVK